MGALASNEKKRPNVLFSACPTPGPHSLSVKLIFLPIPRDEVNYPRPFPALHITLERGPRPSQHEPEMRLAAVPALSVREGRANGEGAQAQKPEEVPGSVAPSGFHPPSPRTLVAAAGDRLPNPRGQVAGETQGLDCGEGVGSSVTAAPPALTPAAREARARAVHPFRGLSPGRSPRGEGGSLHRGLLPELLSGVSSPGPRRGGFSAGAAP